MGRSQPEHKPAHRHQFRQTEFEPDTEHQKDDTEFGEVARFRAIADQPERIRSDQDTNQQVTKQRRQREQTKHGNDDNRREQQYEDKFKRAVHDYQTDQHRMACQMFKCIGTTDVRTWNVVAVTGKGQR